MRLRLPLYGKILTWFFLNLVIVAAVVATLFTLQFHFNLDWIFSAAGAQDRWEAVFNLIIDELDTTRPDEWPQVLDRYSEAYHVRFALFDEEARPLIGGIAELPPEVQTRVLERPVPSSFPAFMRRATPSRTTPSPTPPTLTTANGTNGTDGTYATPATPPATLPSTSTPNPTSTATSTAPAASPSSTPTPRRPRLPLRALMRTSSPTHYWLLASGRLKNPLLGDPMRIVLVARSQTISGGGLILDPRPWFYLGAGIILFSLLFWYPLIRSITRTLRRMMQTTRQIADGRFDVRVNLRRRDELGSLSDSIDQMAVRLDGLVTGQKRFLGDIAHELCSPLARLQMALGILEQRMATAAATHPDSDGNNATSDSNNTLLADTAPFIQTASEKAQQISALVAELLSFSKASFGASTVKLQPVPIRAVLEEAIHREKPETTAVADKKPAPEILIEDSIPEDLYVSGDPDLLLRAFSNLIRNAIQHAGASGPVTIRATQSLDNGGRKEGGPRPAEAVASNLASKIETPADGVGGGGGAQLITIIVADQGPGVPPDELSKIFDAFYRLDTSRTRDTGGTGLGLAIVKTCIDSCCGTVSARPGQPTGLEVHVTLHYFGEIQSAGAAGLEAS